VPVSASRWQKLRQRPFFRVLVDIGLLLAVITGIGLWQTRSHVVGPAPVFSLPLLAGGSQSLEGLKGKPSVVAFWAPWCGVCAQESSNFSRLAGWLGNRANVVSVVSAYQSVDDVRRYVTANGVDYPVLLDQDGVADQYQVKAFPTVYFLDAQGQVKGSVVGYTTTVGLLARLWW
jgi:peroxiredoxin